MKKYILILGLLHLFSGSFAADADIEIEIPSGKLLGTVETSRDGTKFNAFRGIPYAETPKRFEPSKLLTKWDGVRNAKEFGSSCPQFFGTEEQTGDENCLFINVFSPQSKTKGSGLNVIVWFHGGGLQFGHGGEYSPDYFMDHEIILVTLNYRLGILGFLSTGDDTLSGNWGLKDQQLALKWVLKNIKYFGGDKHKVTIMGESAGAASVNFHVLSPNSAGLFQNAIALSGSTLNPWAMQENPKKAYERLLEKTKCKDLKCLKKIGVQKLIEIQNSFMEWFMYPVSTFAPVVESGGVDGKQAFLQEHPYTLMKKGKINKVPYMTGFNKDEGFFFSTAAILADPIRDQMNSEPQKNLPIAMSFEAKDSMTQAVIDHYLSKAWKDGKLALSQENLPEFSKMFGDRWINVGVMQTVELLSKHVKVYPYLYSYEGEASSMKPFFKIDKVLGTTHADEIQFLFKAWAGLPSLEGKNGRSEQFSRNFVKLIVQFAKDGQGTSWDKDTKWAAVDKSNMWKWFEINEKPRLVDVGKVYLPGMKFWNELLFGKSHEKKAEL